MTEYELLKVGQLRTLCKSRGLYADGRKDELIAELIKYDAEMRQPTSSEMGIESSFNSASLEPSLTSEELKELATIADEMRHLRRQWLLQQPRSSQGQSYGSSTVRKA